MGTMGNISWWYDVPVVLKNPGSLKKGGQIMELKSSAFEHKGMIPKKFTCDGEDVSPSLNAEHQTHLTQGAL